MLLSIVMMIKNEEKYLENTLCALTPLMKRIDSEIVILDTGSEDNSINIARKYTNNVYLTKWNNNFADMRNESIKYAKGEWILIIDADEVIVDYEKIISFFQQNKSANYNSASVQLKSFNSENEDLYSIGSVIRMFKNDSELRYEGAIHEQPIYREPTYNNIAKFNHYGYMYSDEKIRNKKLKRNEDILLTELKSSPNNAYINFQLGQNYMSYQKQEEALFYLEKSYEQYKKAKVDYKPVKNLLAKLYLQMGEYIKCEKICKEYMKIDNNDIDINLYLGMSKKYTLEYEESIKYYKRYLYLVENYNKSTQSNDIYCIDNTSSLVENAKLDMIEIYYNIERYEDVIILYSNTKFYKLKNVYFEVLNSLYKLNKEDEIINLYINLNDSIIEKKQLIFNIEKVILNEKYDNKKKIYKILSKLEDNYGKLNKIRFEKDISLKECKLILSSENEAYFGEIIYYALKKGFDLLNILTDIDNIKIQKYLDYTMLYKKECALYIYDYLIKATNTLDLEKLKLYSCAAKSLLFNGDFEQEEYKNVFLMYLRYQYDYMRQVYNNSSNKTLIGLVKNEEDKFILEFIDLQKNKQEDTLQYIKSMKKILVDNPQYNKGINIFIDKFEKELDEAEELKELKSKYKLIIEKSIQAGNLDDCKKMIKEYEEMFEYDDINNIKAIINIYENNFTKAECLLKLYYCSNFNDENVIFNIAYIKELKKEYKDAINFYTEVLKINSDEKLKIEITERIDNIKNNNEIMK